MTTSSRRQFLQKGLVVTSAGLLPTMSRAEPTGTGLGRPRALVQFFLQGGIDSILATDPKRKAEVDPSIDVPYEESEIHVAGPVRIGPLFHSLSNYAHRFAILNGVDSLTVAHPTGITQILQMRRVFPRHAASLLGTLGALRDGGAPVSEVRFVADNNLGAGSPQHAGGRCVVSPYVVRDPTASLFPQLSALAGDESRRIAVSRIMQEEIAKCSRDELCGPLVAARALLDRMPRNALPAPVPLELAPSTDKLLMRGATQWSHVLRDALFLLTHRLTPTILIEAPLAGLWDSHTGNLKVQQKCMQLFAPALRYFLDEIHRRRTSDGTLLADEVGVVISSEFGRFPILNADRGKDHFPQFPVVFFGPGIRAGQYGQTDSRMLSLPISFKNGAPGSTAKDAVPTLEDVAVTLLKWFGVEDAASIGYLGRPLDFLLT